MSFSSKVKGEICRHSELTKEEFKYIYVFYDI